MTRSTKSSEVFDWIAADISSNSPSSEKLEQVSDVHSLANNDNLSFPEAKEINDLGKFTLPSLSVEDAASIAEKKRQIGIQIVNAHLNAASYEREKHIKKDYGEEVLKRVPKCPENASYRLDKIVRHAMERNKIDRSERKTGRPRSLVKIRNLEDKINDCVQLLDQIAWRGTLSDGDFNLEDELSKAFLFKLFGVSAGEDNQGYSEQDGYNTAYQQLRNLHEAVSCARQEIEKYPNEWHKTALSDTAKGICELLGLLNIKPNSYKNGLAFQLLAACMVIAGVPLSDSAYSNALKKAIKPPSQKQ